MNPQTEEPPLGARIGANIDSFLRSHGEFIFSVAATVLFAAQGHLPFLDSSTPGYLVAGGFLLLCALFLRVRTTRSISQLRREREEALASAQSHHEARMQLEQALIGTFQSTLAEVLGHAELDKDTRARASLYVQRENYFELITRWSSNVQLICPDRTNIPLDTGVIGEAWQTPKGWALEWRLPSDIEDWLDTMEEEGLSREKARGLKMHARCLGALRLSYGYQHVGVIVLEHELGTKINNKKLTAIMQSEGYQYLSRSVSALHAHLPGAPSFIARVPGRA